MRPRDLDHFYSLLSILQERTGVRTLNACTGHMRWPRRGVYFFFDSNEYRLEPAHTPRVVRVGTHALIANASSTLWGRLRSHRGTMSGNGNHRGSIFRLLVGQALISKNGLENETWGQGNNASRETKNNESHIEILVSTYIGMLPFLWLDIGDEASGSSLRGIIERNSIALLSNSGKNELNTPSKNWLGNKSNRGKVRASGLWNQNHVDESYDPEFLVILKSLIQAQTEK